MGRRPRVHVLGGIYHVIARGNSRQEIFFEPSDRDLFGQLLAEGRERFDYRIHAFCWMPNHVHLLLQVSSWPVSVIAHNFCFRYARRINRRRGRSGHLFERRHRSILVDSDSQLLTLLRYIHLNPVRAGLVVSPEQYRWSSHRAYLGADAPSWLTVSLLLELLSPDPGRARRLYRQFLDAGDGVSTRLLKKATNARSSRLVEADLQHVRSRTIDDRLNLPNVPLSRVIRAAAAAVGISDRDLAEPSRARKAGRARAIASLLIQECRHLTLEELARATGRDGSTLSKAARRLRERAANDPKASDQIQKARSATLTPPPKAPKP